MATLQVLGNASLTIATINASVASSLVPATTASLALGASGNRWAQLNTTKVDANTVSAATLTATSLAATSSASTSSLQCNAMSAQDTVGTLALGTSKTLRVRNSSTPASNFVDFGGLLNVNGASASSFQGGGQVNLPATSLVRFSGVALSSTLGGYTSSSSLTNPTLSGSTTATDATVLVSATSLAAPSPSSDLIAQYYTNANVCSAYNALSGSGPAFVAGAVTFAGGTNALSTALVTNANASVGGIVGMNTSLSFTLRFQTMPTATNTRFVLLQIGTQGASQNSLCVSLYNNALVVMLSSAPDSRTYNVLAANTTYDFLINKSTTTILEVYQNGIALTPTSSAGAPAYAAYGSNPSLVVGATSVGNTVVGATISNLCVAFCATLHTPTSFAALQQTVASQTLTVGAPLTTKKLLVNEGATTFLDSATISGTTHLSALRYADIIAEYTAGNANAVGSGYNNLTGSIAFVDGTLTFGATTDLLQTSLVDASGATIAGVSSANVCVAFSLFVAYAPTARSVLVQIGARGATQNSLCLTLETSYQLVVWLSATDYYTYAAISPSKSYAVMLVKTPSGGPVLLYLNGALVTGASSGSPTYAAFGSGTLSFGTTTVGQALVGAQLSAVYVAWNGPAAYTPSTFTPVPKSTISGAAINLQSACTAKNTVTLAASAAVGSALNVQAYGGHSDVLPYFSTFPFVSINNYIPTLNQSSVTIVSNASNALQNGTYTITRSNADYGTAYESYQAFNQVSGYWAASGPAVRSISTTVSGSTYIGEWLQIQIPCSMIMTSFTTCACYNSPQTIVIAGSTDNVTWDLIYTIANTGFVSSTGSDTTFGTAVVFNITPTPTKYYVYFRFIVTATVGGGGSQTNLARVNFSGMASDGSDGTTLTTRAGASIAAFTGNLYARFSLLVSAYPTATSLLLLVGAQSATQNSFALTVSTTGVLKLALSSGVYITYSALSTYAPYDVFVCRLTASPYLQLWLNGVLQSGTTTGTPAYVQLGSNTLTLSSSAGVGTAFAGATISNLYLGFSANVTHTPTTFAALPKPTALTTLGLQSAAVNTPLTVNGALSCNASTITLGGPANTVTVGGTLSRIAPCYVRNWNLPGGSFTTPAAYTDASVGGALVVNDANASSGAPPILLSNGVFVNISGYALVARITYHVVPGQSMPTGPLSTWIVFNSSAYTNAVFCRLSLVGNNDGCHNSGQMNLLMPPGSSFQVWMNGGADASKINSQATISIAVY